MISRRMLKLFTFSLVSAALALAQSNAAAAPSTTHTRIDMTAKHLTLEIEMLPQQLQQARLLRELEENGPIQQSAFDEAKAEIIAYVKAHLRVSMNARELYSDSVAVRYQFQEASAAPSRIYITCWYALLLKPEQLHLQNSMLQGLTPEHKNLGTITYGAQKIDFEFPEATAAQPAVVINMQAGTLVLQAQTEPLGSPALLWLGAGASGLLLLAGVAHMRKLARRHARRRKRKQRKSGSAARVSSSSPRPAYELENVVG